MRWSQQKQYCSTCGGRQRRFAEASTAGPKVRGSGRGPLKISASGLCLGLCGLKQQNPRPSRCCFCDSRTNRARLSSHFPTPALAVRKIVPSSICPFICCCSGYGLRELSVAETVLYSRNHLPESSKAARIAVFRNCLFFSRNKPSSDCKTSLQLLCIVLPGRATIAGAEVFRRVLFAVQLSPQTPV